MTDLTTVSNADLAAALQARQLAAVGPLVAAYEALLAVAQTTQAAMAGIINTRASNLVGNTWANASGYLTEAKAIVALLTPATASSASANVGYQTPAMIDLSGDVTNAQTLSITSQPAHGSVTVSNLVATYVPAPGYSGEDSFAYSAVGAGGSSQPATVSLTVAAAAAA